MSPTGPQELRLSAGTQLSFTTAGNPSNPAVLLLHGFPTSARTFRDVIAPLSRIAHVIAPDLPGFGASDVLPDSTFGAFGDAMLELLERMAIGPRFLYLHDFGAPVALHIAQHAPAQVRGLIIQNANAHEAGLGPEWAATRDWWAHPDAAHEAAATAHLTFEGTRQQYLAGLPADLAARIDPAGWKEDWRVMGLPGRMQVQRALIADYAHHVAAFDRIARYLARWQPPSLLLWGRHDAFFDLAETLAWMRSLPRMEAHIFDAGHLLLETHAAEATSLMIEFIAQARSLASRSEHVRPEPEDPPPDAGLSAGVFHPEHRPEPRHHHR